MTRMEVKKFDLRSEFARTYGNARAAHLRGVPSKDLLRLAVVTLRTGCRRLALPRLSPEERARMIGADVPGMHDLVQSLYKTLSKFPPLEVALSLSAQTIQELQNKDLDLQTAIQRATAIASGATRCERRAGAQLKDSCAQTIAAATTLRDSPTADPVAKAQAADLLDTVERLDGRVGRTLKRRQQRLQRRVEALKDSAQETLLRARLESHNVAAARPDSLIQDEPAPAPTAPQKAQRPTAHSDAFPEITGTQLEECLLAPLSDFADTKQQLGAIAAELRDDAPVDPPEDYLYYIELAAILAGVLRQAPLLAQACPISADQLDALCDAADDGALLADTAQLFISMASDGHLFVAAYTALLYQHTTAWLAERAADRALTPEEREAAEIEGLHLKQVYGRSRERLQDRKAAAQDKVAAAQSDLADAQDAANLARVKERLARGLPVDAAAFRAAEEAQHKGHQRDLNTVTDVLGDLHSPAPAPAPAVRRTPRARRARS